MIKMKRIVVGSYEVNCYLVWCDIDKCGVVIDPGDEAERVMHEIVDNKVALKYIINTHAHGDHIGGVKHIKERVVNALYAIHEKDMVILTAEPTKEMVQFLGGDIPPTPDQFLKDDGEITLCEHIKMKIMHTPGHTPGGISVLIGENLFTGDSLFNGSIGRTDFPLSSHIDLIRSIKSKLLVLDDSIKVFPGHGDETTIGDERQYNSFLF